MRRFVPTLLLFVLLAGCGDANRSLIVGSWEISQPDEVAERVSSTDEAWAPSMSLEFQNSGAFKSTTKMGRIDRQKTGTWKWLSFNEKTETAKIETSIEGDVNQFEVEFQDGMIRLVPPNMAGTDVQVEFVRTR